MEVIDIHQHFGDLANALAQAAPIASEGSIEEAASQRVAAMDEAGIDWSVVQPSQMYLRPNGIVDTMRVNDSIAAVQRSRPNRFRLALGTVEPMHGDRSLEEIVRCKETLGLSGLSWHHRFQGCQLDTPWMWPILGRMEELDLVPVFHTYSGSQLEAPWRLQRLAVEFPNLTFIGLDAFHNYDVCESTLFIAERTPNILWDLSGPMMLFNTTWKKVEAWVARHGGERLVYGAELAYSRSIPRGRLQLLETILASSMSEEAKAQILGMNVRRVFAAQLRG